MDQLISLLSALAALAIPLLFAWVAVELESKRETSHHKKKAKK
jgi:hypothetical protein